MRNVHKLDCACRRHFINLSLSLRHFRQILELFFLPIGTLSLEASLLSNMSVYDLLKPIIVVHNTVALETFAHGRYRALFLSVITCLQKENILLFIYLLLTPFFQISYFASKMYPF